ncbi:hypothetical protein H0H92_012466 [Tricholoma furcatifolium]|nr:hypothetical protein H0H92_012466 [Tricholoma furcatifolium]
MSARQNKKQRKGRNNRERTVTTLTEDPNTHFLVPRPSEEPAGSLMSSPFSVASSSTPNVPSSSAYQPPSNYEAFPSFTEFGSQQQFFSQQVQQQQQQMQKPKPIALPGANDYERLENLKNIIKSNQHANFRPVPQPEALAAHYLGPLSTPQLSMEQNQFRGPADGPLSASSNPSSPVDLTRGPPRLQNKEWEQIPQRKPVPANAASLTNNVLSDSSHISAPSLTSSSSFPFSTQTNMPSQGYIGRFDQDHNAPAAIDTSNLQGGSTTNSAGPISAEPKSIEVSMSDTPTTMPEGAGPSPRFDSSVRPTPSNYERGHGDTSYSGPRGPGTTDKGSYDGKDELRTPREGSWTMKDGPPPDDRRRDLDRPPPSPRTTMTGSAGGSDTRSNPGDRPPISRDDRFYDRDRDRDYRDRDRRDWDRRPIIPDRYRDDRYRMPPEAVRRPPPEQRHYEPDYGDRGPPRRYEVKEEPISDARRLADLRRPPSPLADDRRPLRPEEDRTPLSARLLPASDPRGAVDVSRSSHPDSRPPAPPARTATPESRHVRPSFEERNAKPAVPDERRAPPSDSRPAVPPARTADASSANRPTDARDHRDVALTPAETSRPSIPLEERIGTRPSLQERIGQPADHITQSPASRPEPARPAATLEERLSAMPVSTDPRDQRARVTDRTDNVPPPVRSTQSIDDRTAARPLPAASAQDDRPGRYTRAMSPPGERSTYPPPHSASSAPRAPSPRSNYRPSRPLSRERASSYRPEDRHYMTDDRDRRADAMDVDTPRYDRMVPYNRPFSPPSAADLARDRARAAQYQPPPSPPRGPPHTHDQVPYDDDRRYLPRRDWQPSYQSSYGDHQRSSREWSASDEEFYKSRQWEGRGSGAPPAPPPPASLQGSAADRDRYDRNNGWETRSERERREYPPPRAPPSPSPSSRPSYDRPPPPGSVSGAPPPPQSSSERGYPPPQSQAQSQSQFSRVRQRSLSPPRRDDDTRGPPPPKRTRDDAYATGDYYPPPPSSSLARGATPAPPPPPSSSGSGGGGAYFDSRGPPPPPSSVSGAGGAGGGERDYGRYVGYERPRSPGRGGPGGGAGPSSYSRASYPHPHPHVPPIARDSRDEARRYVPPPPPPSQSSSSSMPMPRR